MSDTAFVDHAFFGRIEKELLRFYAIARTPAVKTGMRNAVNIPAKRTREKLRGLPAYKVDKKGKGHLGDAVGVSVYQDDTTGNVIGRVTWVRSVGGYHGHLVELGHRIVRGGTLKARKTTRRNTSRSIDRSRLGRGKVIGSVPGKFYLADSWDETKSEQNAALEAGVAKALAGKN